MIYSIKIVGLMDIEADSKDEAIEKVKEKFYDELLSIDDLHISAEEVKE